MKNKGPFEAVVKGSEGYWIMAPARKPHIKNEREPYARVDMLDWETDKEMAYLIAELLNKYFGWRNDD